MNTSTTATAVHRAEIAIGIEVVPIDAMSTVRHLHASSAKRLAAGMLSEAEIQAFVAHIYSPEYSARLTEIAAAGRLFEARLGDETVATAGWIPANDAGNVARLIGVFVSPLYARLGIGRRLVATAEEHARRAGFSTFTIRAPLGASEFFERQGYGIASHGVWPLTRDTALPVAFLRKVEGGLKPSTLRVN